MVIASGLLPVSRRLAVGALRSGSDVTIRTVSRLPPAIIEAEGARRNASARTAERSVVVPNALETVSTAV